MTKQMGFLMDLSRCVGCRACEIGCKNEYKITGDRRRRVIEIADGNQVTEYISMACNHCSSPACMAVCPNKCYSKRRDGIVVHNPSHCDGCKTCVAACPFDAPKFSSATGKIDKCNMCVGRQDQGLRPACISACITGALRLIEIDEDDKYERSLLNIKLKKITNPSVRFIAAGKPLKFLIKE